MKEDEQFKELERQIALAWKRGCDYGKVLGYILSSIIILLVIVIILLTK